MLSRCPWLNLPRSGLRTPGGASRICPLGTMPGGSRPGDHAGRGPPRRPPHKPGRLYSWCRWCRHLWCQAFFRLSSAASSVISLIIFRTRARTFSSLSPFQHGRGLLDQIRRESYCANALVASRQLLPVIHPRSGVKRPRSWGSADLTPGYLMPPSGLRSRWWNGSSLRCGCPAPGRRSSLFQKSRTRLISGMSCIISAWAATLSEHDRVPSRDRAPP